MNEKDRSSVLIVQKAVEKESKKSKELAKKLVECKIVWNKI